MVDRTRDFTIPVSCYLAELREEAMDIDILDSSRKMFKDFEYEDEKESREKEEQEGEGGWYEG